MRLGMFDPANDSSYHTLSPADVNTADSQVLHMQTGKSLIHMHEYCPQELALKLAQESIVLLQNNKSKQ